ncbi:alpha/beta fold hydrolase [Alkanindiges sp. WGS2144]|uniref:alpha/beta fold hydrolase n=1 Tax=Alkanindiges sp. WGS2144 TaxID=3366808 RepID=UPI0037537945
MNIYDLFSERSLVRYFSEKGFNVYLIDWGTPTRQHAALNFEHYVLDMMPKLLAQVRQHSGQQQLSLHGWSMAGVFTLLYAAASRDVDIKNIIILGTPIDAYTSGGIGRLYKTLGHSFRWLQKTTGLHPRQIPVTLLHSPGWSNALGFKLLDPVGTLKGHINLLKQLDNRKAVEAHATLGAFLNHMVDYPGGINRDMLLKVWMENSLSRGEFPIGGKTVYLKNIQASLLAGAGLNDGMVTVEAVQPLTRLVGSDDTDFATIPGGHVGLMGSQQAATEFWPYMASWLAARSD